MDKHTLDRFRKLATQTLACKEKPTKRHEEWRHSDLKLLKMGDSTIKTIDEKVFLSLDERCYNVFLVNGKLDKNKSILPKAGVRIYEANDQEFIDELFKIDLKNGFDNKYQVLQSYSKMKYGILINITQDLDKPLKICYFNTGNHHITFVKIGKEVGAKLYEEFVQYGDRQGYLDQVTKIELSENSTCKHFKQHNFTGGVHFLYSSKIVCKEYSQYDNYILNMGCKSYRQDVECYLQGKRASGNFYGVAIGKGQETYNMVLKIEHQSSYTTSTQHYNQVLVDKSHGSFISNTKILKFLNGVKACQLNKNLLLDKKTKSFSKPELDIHSDDVVCSHGATVGSIDEDTVYYLKSRGIDKQTAEKLIVQGFLKAVFEDKGLENEDYKRLTHQIANHTSDSHIKVQID